MSTFPFGGDVKATRAWLDKKGFDGLLTGWKADAIIGLNEPQVLSVVPGENGLRLCGYLQTARNQGASHIILSWI